MTRWLRGTAMNAGDVESTPQMVTAIGAAARSRDRRVGCPAGFRSFALVKAALAQRARPGPEANQAVSVSTDRDDWVDASAQDREEAGEQA